MATILFQSLAAAFIYAPSAHASSSWRDTAWPYRKSITIDHTQVMDQDQSDFILLFQATDADLKSVTNGGKVGTDSGQDILFTSADGTTKLSHEIETYDPISGSVSAWIRLPQLSHTQGTLFYVYYGNPAATDQQDKGHVYDSSYQMVQHMDAGLQDSTPNANDAAGSGNTSISGKIGQAQSFDGSGRLTVPDSSTLRFGNGDWTVSFWVKPSAASTGALFGKGHLENRIHVQQQPDGTLRAGQDYLEKGRSDEPYDIWTDGTYLYITDSYGNRIVKRKNSDLSYVAEVGTKGSGNDQFDYPTGIYGDGIYLYITDDSNNRIVKRRASDLSYVSQVGTYGSGNDQFEYPDGIYGDGTYLFIADSGNNRIVKRLASDLSYVSQIGTEGTGNDQFEWPEGIWGDGDNIYIADCYNHRIVKRLASDLSYVSQIGTEGTGNDQFEYPYGIWGYGAYLYVVDSSNNRIVKRKASDLSYVAQFGTYGLGDNRLDWPTGGAGDGTYLYVADNSNNRIVKYNISDFGYVSEVATLGSGDDQFNYAEGIWNDGTYLYIDDTNNNRIVKRRASDLSYVNQVGTEGTGNDQFNHVRGIWGDGTYLYVADAGNNRIVKRLASDLSYVSQVGTSGTGNDQFKWPWGIWGDGTYLYIIDYGNNRIVKRLASDLSYVSQVGTSGTGNDQFRYPSGVWGDGTWLYIADVGNHRIVKRLASDLSYVAKMGSRGTGNNQFDSPYGVWGDGTYLYVADSGNHRIVKIKSSDLSYVSQVGAYGVGRDQFNFPTSVSGDDTYLYVLEDDNGRLQKRKLSDLSYADSLSSAVVSTTSSSSLADGSYHQVTVTKTHPENQPYVLSLYVDGSLSNAVSSTAIDDLASTSDDLLLGNLFTGAMDEVRIQNVAQSLPSIRTEYGNQNDPAAFYSLGEEEDSFPPVLTEVTPVPSLTSALAISYTFGSSKSGTISYTGSCSSPDVNAVAGNNTVMFENLPAGTYAGCAIQVTTSQGIASNLLSIPSFTVSRSVALVTPAKPAVANVTVTQLDDGSSSIDNLPSTIIQLAISTTSDFSASAWQDISQKDALLKQYAGQTVYLKFRTQDGGVSDPIVFTLEASSVQLGATTTTTTLQDGDIVKTPDSPDVYIIKLSGGKHYKRLILSPVVFNSYRHLKWYNIKTISQEQLDQYQTSNLARELTDAIVYAFSPQGDKGRKQPVTGSYDQSSVYIMNRAERDSYAGEG